MKLLFRIVEAIMDNGGKVSPAQSKWLAANKAKFSKEELAAIAKAKRPNHGFNRIFNEIQRKHGKASKTQRKWLLDNKDKFSKEEKASIRELMRPRPSEATHLLTGKSRAVVKTTSKPSTVTPKKKKPLKETPMTPLRRERLLEAKSAAREARKGPHLTTHPILSDTSPEFPSISANEFKSVVKVIPGVAKLDEKKIMSAIFKKHNLEFKLSKSPKNKKGGKKLYIADATTLAHAPKGKVKSAMLEYRRAIKNHTDIKDT